MEQQWLFRGREATSKCKGGSQEQGFPGIRRPPNQLLWFLGALLFLRDLKTLWAQLMLWFKTHRIRLCGFFFSKSVLWGHIKESFYMATRKLLEFSFTLDQARVVKACHSVSYLRGLDPLISSLLSVAVMVRDRVLWAVDTRWTEVHGIHSFATGYHELLDSHSGF